MQLVRRVLKTQAGRTLLVVLLLWGSYTVWAIVQASAKIDDQVAQLVDARGRVNVEVELAFPPERFHILVVQDHARIRRTIGNVVHARGELPDLRRLARRHWVREIRPAEDPGAASLPRPRNASALWRVSVLFR